MRESEFETPREASCSGEVTRDGPAGRTCQSWLPAEALLNVVKESAVGWTADHRRLGGR
jgi:hypothetical protein